MPKVNNQGFLKEASFFIQPIEKYDPTAINELDGYHTEFTELIGSDFPEDSKFASQIVNSSNKIVQRMRNLANQIKCPLMQPRGLSLIDWRTVYEGPCPRLIELTENIQQWIQERIPKCGPDLQGDALKDGSSNAARFKKQMASITKKLTNACDRKWKIENKN